MELHEGRLRIFFAARGFNEGPNFLNEATNEAKPSEERSLAESNVFGSKWNSEGRARFRTPPE